MPWATTDNAWVDMSSGLTSVAWNYAGNFVKVTTSNPTSSFTYVTHIPLVMNCLNGSLKTGIKIKASSESTPNPGGHATDIWFYYQYHVNRGNFSQIEGYWESPRPRSRRRMRILGKGIR